MNMSIFNRVLGVYDLFLLVLILRKSNMFFRGWIDIVGDRKIWGREKIICLL